MDGVTFVFENTVVAATTITTELDVDAVCGDVTVTFEITFIEFCPMMYRKLFAENRRTIEPFIVSSVIINEPARFVGLKSLYDEGDENKIVLPLAIHTLPEYVAMEVPETVTERFTES
jgi:hypothetical protein